MNKEKRVLKGYKIKDSIYQKAKRLADKGDVPLAVIIEAFVTAYADGMQIRAIRYENNTAIGTALDFIAPKVS